MPVSIGPVSLGSYTLSAQARNSAELTGLEKVTQTFTLAPEPFVSPGNLKLEKNRLFSYSIRSHPSGNVPV
jgi:hypothetical protein